MSARSEAAPVSGTGDSELHGLSLAKLSIQTDIGAFDTDSEDEGPADAQVPAALPDLAMQESDNESDDGEPAVVPIPPQAPPPAQPVQPAQPDAAAADSGSETEGEEDMVPAPPPPAPSSPQPPAGPSEVNPRTEQTGKRNISRMEQQQGERVEWTDSDDDEPAAVPIPAGPSAPQPMPAPLDVSNPEKGEWRSRSGRGPEARLKEIELLFRNPKTLRMDSWMKEADTPGQVEDVVNVLLRILSDMRSLAIVTPLIAMLMNSKNKKLKLQVASIVKQVNEVVSKHIKNRRMKRVQNELAELRKLMHTFANLSSEKALRLKQMKGFLLELESAVRQYVEDSFVDEAYPDWYLQDTSQKQRLQIWQAEKSMRKIAAGHKAMNEYRSVLQLRAAIRELERDIALFARGGKSTKTSPSDTPSSSKDTGAGEFVIELDESEDDDTDGSAVQPMQAEEEEVDTGEIIKKAKEMTGALMYLVSDSLIMEEALMAVIRIAESGEFNETDWKNLVQGLLNAARQGTYSDNAVGYRHVTSIKAIREFLRDAGKKLSSLSPRAAEWWKENKYEVPQEVIEDLIKEADNAQVSEMPSLKDTDALDDVNRALESVRIIAAAAGHRVDAWNNLAQGLEALYRIYNNPLLQSPRAVGRLIGFLERAANILRMKYKDSSQWFDMNVNRFVNPQGASGQRPMELGATENENDIPEEIYADDFEDDESDGDYF